MLLHILLPTRISKTSTLTDNTFSNSTSSEEIESGKVASTFSDHLTQFESNKFISDFDQTDWEQNLCFEKKDVNFTINQYLSKIDSLLETHAPL